MQGSIRRLWRALIVRKPIDTEPQGYGLRRCLSAFDLAILGVGAIIGTGIFVLTGVAAATTSGPAVVLSFVVAGITCAFAALSYAELAASVGGSGSAYNYSYAAFGECVAWIIGWDLILEYGVAVAAVANGWAGYFNNMLTAVGLSLPEMLTKGPFARDPLTGEPDGGWVNLPAVIVVLALMTLLISGAKHSARWNLVMVIVKVATIFIFLAVAIFHVNPDNWHPFMPYGWLDMNAMGKPVGVLAGASIVFFAYIGFDAVATAADEANRPQRDLPIGLIGSLVFCTLIYVAVSGVLTGIVPWPLLNVPSPVAFGLEQIGITWASALVATGVLAGLTTVILVLFYALTRVIAAMSRDGLLPGFFSDVSQVTQTPIKNTLLCGSLMAFLAGFVPLDALAELVNIGTLAAFAMVCLGVIVLRFTHPDLPRPFRLPFGILLPTLGVLSCGALIAFLPDHTHWRFILWLAAGLVIYFFYGYRHSRLRHSPSNPTSP